jgi:acyl-CoA hydrolase
VRALDKLRLRGSTTRTLWFITGGLALALVVVVVVGAIRASRPPRGRDVAAYVERVNRLQGLATGPLTQLNAAYAEFGTSRGRTSAHLDRLARGEGSLRALRAQLAQVPAPKKALPIRAQLLRLYDMQVAFARDVTQFARYLAHVGAPERRAEAARLELLRALRTAQTGKGQADAFEGYGAAAGAAAMRLEKLRAPAEFDRARTTEVARLQELSNGATQAARALRVGDRAAVQKAISTFSRSSSTIVVAVRQRAAAIAYNRRLRAIETQRTRLARTQQRVQKSL